MTVDLIPLVREALRAWRCDLSFTDMMTPELDVAMDALEEAADKIETERHAAARPSTLRDLPAWHLSRPKCANPFIREPWGLALPDGRAGATDGAAILLVADAPVPPLTHPQFLSAEACAERLKKFIGTADADYSHEMAVHYDDIVRWLDAPRVGEVVSVGECRLTAFLLDAWVRSAACAAPDPIRVRWSEVLGPVRFDGESWTAIVMPRRHVEDEDAGPELEVSR